MLDVEGYSLKKIQTDFTQNVTCFQKKMGKMFVDFKKLDVRLCPWTAIAMN